MKSFMLSRKPSILGLRAHAASTSHLETPQPERPLSSQSPRRYTSHGLRSLVGRFRSTEPDFEILTPSSLSPSTQKASPPQISQITKAFVDSLNAQQLSNFLTWMLYYDSVELPETPDSWYVTIDHMEMRGWVALGKFLSKTLETGSGFDLVVLESICDRIGLPRTTVWDFLIQFADHEKMAFSQIAAVTAQARADSLSHLQTLEAVQAKLHELYGLATKLKPTENSKYDVWHAIVQKRLRGYLHLVIDPRIANLRSGAPLITSGTSDLTPKEIHDGIQLNYLFEAMQQKRPVPLARYGLYRAITVSPFVVQSFSPPGVPDRETERARNHAIELMAQNRDLRAQVLVLQDDNKNLTKRNIGLERSVAKLEQGLSQGRPFGFPGDSHAIAIPPRISSLENDHSQNQHLQVPSFRFRPRSLSHDTGLQLAAAIKRDITNPPRKHKHNQERSDVLAWKYEDVFSSLTNTPSPTFRLSDPQTGELATAPVPTRHPARPVTYAPTLRRRDGRMFTPRSGGSRGGSGDLNSEEGNDGGDVGVVTPTPMDRRAGSRKTMG